MKKMTESQAWLYLTRKWDKPEISNDWVCCSIRIEGFRSVGLCNSIMSLYYKKKINALTYSKMTKELNKYRVYHRFGAGSYFWTLDKQGAAQRAQFCRNRANLCRRK